jgi:hypothetical protein
MTGINEALLDAAIDHQVDLSQFGEGVVRRMMSLLNKADEDIFIRLNETMVRMPPGSFTVQRLDAILSSIRTLNTAAYSAVGEQVSREMEDLALFEAEYQKTLWDNLLPAQVTTGAVVASQVYAAAMAEPFQGRLLKEWYDGLATTRQQRLRDAISMGYVQNESIPDIVKRIRGTKANGYADGILEVDRRNAAAIARTAVSHVSGYVRDSFYEQNTDLVKAVVWVSTLDMRTTSECQIRDGRKYTLKDHKPIGHNMPWLGGPGRLHWNCRSSSTVVLKSWKELGLKGEDLPESTRASMDGQVPGETTYLKWLGKQSAARQDEILGSTRGALLREGKLIPSRFWDDKGRYLTIAELRERHAAAFRKAGV